MQKKTTGFIHVTFLTATLCTAAVVGTVRPAAVVGADTENEDVKAEFFKLCDLAREELHKEKTVYTEDNPRPREFFIDSYTARAVAVAYDMTGKKDYLDACKLWSDRMVECQDTMIPKGAYYMNYGRKPGEDKGEWYSADSSSIAMGVLATAVRCDDPVEKERYLNSVKSFAKLVIDNYVGPGGGITDGLWNEFDGEWYCSSGIFGSVVFLLYDETGDEQYLKVGLNDLDWLNKLDYRNTKHIGYADAAPAVMMYSFEAFAPGVQHLKPGSERHKAAWTQIDSALEWMAEHQAGRQAADIPKKPWMNYGNHHWGTKFGGLPYLMYVFSRHMDEDKGEALRKAADQEMRYISSLIVEKQPDGGLKLKNVSYQFKAFSMMSYAEKLSHGALLRKSKPAEGNVDVYKSDKAKLPE